MDNRHCNCCVLILSGYIRQNYSSHIPRPIIPISYIFIKFYCHHFNEYDHQFLNHYNNLSLKQSIHKLIHQQTDMQIGKIATECILLSYPLYCTSHHLLQLIIKLNQSLQENKTDLISSPTTINQIHQNIDYQTITIIRVWYTHFKQDFDSKHYSSICRFIKKIAYKYTNTQQKRCKMIVHSVDILLQSIEKHCRKQRDKMYVEGGVKIVSIKHEAWRYIKYDKSKSVKVYAHHLSLAYMNIFNNITKRDLFHYVMKSKQKFYGTNLKIWTRHNAILQKYIISQVSQATNKLNCIVLYLNVLYELFELTNFNSFYFIYNGLISESLQQLDDVWKEVNHKHGILWNDVQNKFNKIIKFHRNIINNVETNKQYKQNINKPIIICVDLLFKDWITVDNDGANGDGENIKFTKIVELKKRINTIRFYKSY
eukprot:364235_1